MTDLAATLLPASPSQLRAVSELWGDAKAAHSLFCEERQFLYQKHWVQITKEGLTEGARASSSVFAKSTTFCKWWRDLHMGKALPSHHQPLTANTWPCSISCWNTSSFLNWGSKASKGNNFSLHLFDTLVQYSCHRLSTDQDQGAAKPAPCRLTCLTVSNRFQSPRISLLKYFIRSLSLKMVFNNMYAALRPQKSYSGS